MSTEDYIRKGLMDRGAPLHIANAFIANFKSESGLNPTIREGALNVHGTRGFGLYQLTDTRPGVGRETDFRNFASSRGADPNSIDTQLDFLFFELNGKEKAAGQAIFAQTTTAGAAQTIVSRFLRPAKEHELNRRIQYAGLGGAGEAGAIPASRSKAIDLNNDGFIDQSEREAAGIELGGGSGVGTDGRLNVGIGGSTGGSGGLGSRTVPEAIDRQSAQSTANVNSTNALASEFVSAFLDSSKDYFGRIVIVLLGIIFVAGGVFLFGKGQLPVSQIKRAL